jgi:hypothetical protein
MRKSLSVIVGIALLLLPGCRFADWLVDGGLSGPQHSIVNSASGSPNERIQAQAAEASRDLHSTYGN